MFRSGVDDRKPWDTDFYHLDWARNKLWIHFRGEPLIEAGVVVKLVAAAQAVTVARFNRDLLYEQFARLRGAVQLANLGHWSWDAASGDIICSDRCFRIARRETGLGTPNWMEMLAVYDSAYAAKLEAAVHDTLQSGAL